LVKFVFLLAMDGEPGAAEPLTAFILPTLGSILGVVAALGIAAPLVAARKAVVAVPATVVTALVFVVVVSAVSNAAQEAGPVADSANVVVRTETAALVSGLLWLAAAAWLFLRKTNGRKSHIER
jgi:cellobiose-specific phosphotransferase system component IIC